MHCPNCKAELPDGASVCTECGYAVTEPPMSEPEPMPAVANSSTNPSDEELVGDPVAPQAEPTETPSFESEGANEMPQKKTPPNKMLLLGIGVAAVLLIGIAIAVFGPSSSKSSSSGSTSPAATESKPDKSLCIDSNGYITVYAFTELSGQELLDFAKEKGYQFTDSNGTMGWETKDQACGFLVHVGPNEDQANEEALAKLSAGGAGEVVWYQLICENYHTAEEALTGMGNVTYAQKNIRGDDFAYGIIESSHGKRFFVMAQINESRDVSVMVLNEEAISAGIMGDAGSTINELYEWCSGTRETSKKSAPTQDFANGVFTTHAVLSHTGEELVALAYEQGFGYNGELGGYVNARKTSFLGVIGSAGVLDEAAIRKLPAGGGTEPVYFMVQGLGYASAAAAFETLNSFAVIDKMDASTYTCTGVIEGPASKRYLAFVTNGESAESDNYTLTLFSDEAIAAGLFKQFTQRDLGMSIGEVWKNFTGVDVGSYSLVR